MKALIVAAALALPAFALAQDTAKDKPKPAAAAQGPVAKVNGVPVPRARLDYLVEQQKARGGEDNEQMRAMVRNELVNREIIAQEAQRTGITKRPEVQAQMDLARQEVVVNAYLRDWVAKHPVSDAEIQKEYERAKAETGGKEYRARHILVESEEEAKGLIAQLGKGGNFDELAEKHSKDPGSRERGGDLDWNLPSSFDRQFSDAMVKLEKGQHTTTPVRTRFGFHIIKLEDVRPASFPALAQVKPRIEQQLVHEKVQSLLRGLREKAKIE